jgi:hypothetical protein
MLMASQEVRKRSCLSFPRRRESSISNLFWTPAFAGVTAWATSYETINVDGLVRSQKTSSSVIPAEAGIQEYQEVLDPGFRRGDSLEDFLRVYQCSMINVK